MERERFPGFFWRPHLSDQDCYVVKTLFGFKAADELTEQTAANYGLGELIRVKFYKGRNIKFHRLYFGLLKLVFENQETYLSMEGLRFAVTLSAGFADEVRLDGNRVALKPRSIAFSKMDEHEFKDYFAACVKAIPRLLPQFDGMDLEAELLKRGERW